VCARNKKHCALRTCCKPYDLEHLWFSATGVRIYWLGEAEMKYFMLCESESARPAFCYTAYMHTKSVGLLVLLTVMLGGSYYIYTREGATTPVLVVPQASFDPKQATFEVEGVSITLVNGFAQYDDAPGSATKVTTRYFGNEAKGDLNGDGRDDVAFLVTQDRGGTGIFYYVVVALNTPEGYRTTNAFLIGDRIAPQPTDINASAGELYVNFAERKPDEPMSAQPSVAATLYLKVTSAGVLEGLMR